MPYKIGFRVIVSPYILRPKPCKFLLRLLILLCVSTLTVAWAQSATLVKDILPQPTSDLGSSPQQFAVLGNRLFFSSQTDGEGRELWKSDGTEGTTGLVRDIYPGTASSEPTRLIALTPYVLFCANDGVSGKELWRTDGTRSGTVRVKDILPGPDGSEPAEFALSGGVLYFVANDGTHGRELWKTDGTEAGTVLVKDVSSTGSSDPRDLTVMNGTVYFAAHNGVSQPIGLWKSDGTEAGTVSVKAFAISQPENFTVVGNTLFFYAADGFTNGFELWKSDGTSAGTVMVKDINPGAADSYIRDMVNANGTLFFSAINEASGQELWKSDGTSAGTVLVSDIVAGTGSSGATNLYAVGSNVYFAAGTAANGRELWISNGTVAGTAMVKDIAAGSSSSLDTTHFPPSFAVLGGYLYFPAADASGGRELWRTDGTSAGTARVQDIFPGTAASIPTQLTTVGASVMFAADDGTRGIELWKTDGSVSGTVRVRNIRSGAPGSYISGLIDMGGNLYFSANDFTHGTELWRSNGTAAGTLIVKDLRPGTDSSGPQYLQRVGSKVFFTAYEPATGYEVYASDGTSAGTSIVKDIRSGSESSVASFLSTYTPDFTDVDGKAYFAADDGIHGYEVWSSDGTAAGTTLVKDINRTAGEGSSPSNLTYLNGYLYFDAHGGGSGFDLWRSNGTALGTGFVKRLGAGDLLTAIGDSIYFEGDGGNNVGIELFKTDGTATGTVLVKNIAPDGLDSRPDKFTQVNDTVYFSAEDGLSPWAPNPHGRELWKSDGTQAGTAMVADLFPGATAGDPRDLTRLGNRLLFTANDPDHGREVWVTDGTSAGTILLGDIYSGASSSIQYPELPIPLPIARIIVGTVGTHRDFALFAASDGDSGVELWWTDGTPAGTRLLQDIAPGVFNSNPYAFCTIGNLVYFLANDGVHGEELWVFDATQIDSDADGIPDVIESTLDTDGDTTPNYLDPDSDDDSLPDSSEGASDPDGDALPNFMDTDSDGDGMPDEWESEQGLDPYVGTGANGPDADPDGDGYGNAEEYGNGTDPQIVDAHPLSVTTPNGSETWNLGQSYAITWANSGVTGTIRIDLLKHRAVVRTLGSGVAASAGSWNWSIPSDVVLGNDYRIKVVSESNSHVNDLSNADFSITTSAHPHVTVEQGAGQADPTSDVPIRFDIQFERAVTNFDKIDITMGGTATGVAFSVTPTGPSAAYTLLVTGAQTPGTLVPSIASGRCTDLAGNTNLASTSADNSVAYVDPVPPTVTVEQSFGQEDPTFVFPILFDVTFSEDVTGFDASDVVISGTAGQVTFTVTTISGNDRFRISITGAEHGGQIIASVPAGACSDVGGNPNAPSTSVDNRVTYTAKAENEFDLQTDSDSVVYGGPDQDRMTMGGAIAMGDVNGDGYDDLVLGAEEDTSGPTSGGHAYICFGGPGFSGTRDVYGQFGPKPDVIITGANTMDLMATSGLVKLGDLNGDGIKDVVLGAPWADGPSNARQDAGEIYVLYGRTSWPSTISIAANEQSVTIYGAETDDHLAYPSHVSSPGWMLLADLNLDGIEDLIAAAEYADGPGNTHPQDGCTYVIYGSSALPSVVDLANNEQDVWMLGCSGVLRAGDINGDGGNDLVLGSRNSSNAYAVYGSRTLPALIDVIGGESDVHFVNGWANVNLGDLNGDGIEDIVFGLDSYDGLSGTKYNCGEACIIFGSPSLPSTLNVVDGGADVTLIGADQRDYLTDEAGIDIADVTGDGIEDLIMAASEADGPDNARSNCGELLIMYGRPTWPASVDFATTPPDTRFYGRGLAAYLGHDGWITSGDINADGVADIFAAAHEPNGSIFFEAFVVFGSSDLPASIDFAAGDENMRFYNGVGPYHSYRMGGDVNADGMNDLVIGDYGGNGPLNNRTAAGEAFVIFGSTAFSRDALPDTAEVRRWSHSGDPLPQAFGTARASIDFAQGDASSQTTVLLTRNDLDVNMPDLTKVADVTWHVNSNRLNAGSRTLRFTYLNSEVFGIGEATLKVYGATSSEGPFVELPSSVKPTTNKIEATSSGDYSYFILAGEWGDADGDGLLDIHESNTGHYVGPHDTGTDPYVADTDDDGLNDGDEILQYGSDPFVTDSDGDGFSDGLEVALGASPTDANDVPPVPLYPGLALVALLLIGTAVVLRRIHSTQATSSGT
ncbi:MAG: hypothetical protein K1Y02_04710 [Candidatus Hydrogenedentes bacterium]|nr:hypothetical protein [Candidatus Hydrogenedentota bacterium]